MRTAANASTRASSYGALGGLVILATLCGYAVARVEEGYAIAGGLVLATALVAWLLTSDRAELAAPAVGARADATIRLFRVPRAAFLLGLLLLGQLTLRPFLSTTASDYLFLAALATMLGGLLVSGRRQLGLVPGGVVAGAALFAVGACVSAFSSDTAGDSIGVVARFLYLTLVWIWVATVVLRRAGDVRTGVAFWVASIAASGTAAIAQFLLGDVIPGTDTTFDRMTGTTQHVNDLGGSAAVALPAAVGLALLSRAGRPIQLLGIVGTVLITSGLILSGSIGGMLAAAVGVGVAAIATKHLRAFGVAAAVIVAAALATTYFQPAESAGTVSGRIDAVSGPSGTLAARIEVFELAWARIADNPLVGVGLGFDPRAAGAALPDLIHNAFLSAWYQAGLIALIGLALIGVTALRVGLRATREAERADERVLAGSLVGAFAAYLAFGLGTPTLYARYGWVPVALVVALRAIQIRRSSSDGEAAA